MKILWDEKNRDEFIKLCIGSLNKAKKTQIKINWIESNEDIDYLEIGTTVYGRSIFTWVYRVYYYEIYNLFGISENETLDLNKLTDEKKLKLGKYIVAKVWTLTLNKI